MYNAGDFNTTETVHIPINTFSSDDPSASVTITNLAAGDIEIHKDGSTTQRASDSGVTVTIDFDSVTGNHMINIDLSDDTDAGFYANGSRYHVRMEGTTIDGATVNAWIGGFSIGCVLRPTTAGMTLDVSATGEAGLDFDNIKDATGAHTLNNITVPTVTALTGHTPQTADHTAAIAGAATAAKLTKYIQLLARSDPAIETDNATELTEINADGGSGAGNFSAQTDSGEAIRDHVGDGTNLTEAGGTGNQLTAVPWNSDWDAEVESECKDAIDNHAFTGTDSKALISTDAQDLSTTLDVNMKTMDDIDFGATMKTSLETAVDSGLDNDISSPTAGSAAWILHWLGVNVIYKAIITEANGNEELHDRSNVSLGTVNTRFTSDGTYTSKLLGVI